MKKSFLLISFFVFISIRCFPKEPNPQVIHFNKLPDQGLLLDKGWKIHLGDNSEWNIPAFDDKDWNSININQPVRDFLQITNGNICWLRFTFTLNASSPDSLLALSIEQYGASEVFIDGQLIRTFGKLNPLGGRINYNPHSEPVAFHLSKHSFHTIAVRFASDIPSPYWMRRLEKVVPLTVRMQPLPSALVNLKTSLIESRIAIGIATVYLVFGLLFLLLFIFYPLQKLNLFFGLFCLCIVLLSITNIYLNEAQYTLNQLVVLQFLMDYLGRAIGMNVFLFMLLALFSKIKRWQWLYVSFVLTIDFLLYAFFTIQYSLITDLLYFAFIILTLWLFFEVLRRHKRENWMIGLLAFLVTCVNGSTMLRDHWGINFVPYIDIIFPVMALPSMAIYLALKYASTQSSLQHQLVQVKKLSEENIRQEQEKQLLLGKQNETLEQQVKQRTAQISSQKETLQITVQELKATQNHLIQQEKMASLGELTAGIAHEIQNPLNFVNNFSDVNKELLIEMKNEMSKGNLTDAEEIANDVIANEEKINHHGKRADSIVKGMLLHSRTTKGEKEPTDINALADEYLRLAYQGLRAKDQTFNVAIKTDFDASIGKINIIPQDVGRVVLNLINNAFYAVNEKQKQILPGYEPTVTVKTSKNPLSGGRGAVMISVKDNGPGIPQKNLDKIFQPFFTTKPTGQGTGLGLSLSYDIIKALGGELKVETKEGEGTEFIILLPIV